MRIVFKIYLVVFSLFLTACGGGDGVNVFSMAKETLTREPFYISDICLDEYAKYEFKEDSYRKTLYKTENLEEIDEVLEDKLEYTTTLQVSIYQDNDILDCTVTAKDDNGSVTLICIQRGISGYSTIKKLWDSREKALFNKTDCL